MGRSQEGGGGGRGTCSIHDREERYFFGVENLHPLNFFWIKRSLFRYRYFLGFTHL